jgi:hypothetical protein
MADVECVPTTLPQRPDVPHALQLNIIGAPSNNRYACTFFNCGNRFDSKDKWAGHENSEHFSNDMWRCGYKNSVATSSTSPSSSSSSGGDSTKPVAVVQCMRIFHQKAKFMKHMKEEHDVNSSETLRDLEGRWRTGRNWQHQFWCGFCDADGAEQGTGGGNFVRVESIGMEAWKERFDHIEAHFDTEMDISIWVHIDGRRNSPEQSKRPRNDDGPSDISPKRTRNE